MNKSCDQSSQGKRPFRITRYTFLTILVIAALNFVIGTAYAYSVVISSAQYDAPGNDWINMNGEWVSVTNNDATPVSLKGWTLSDQGSNVYTFPVFTLAPSATVTVHTGSGMDNQTDLYWGSSSPIWNNNGDIATLADNNGNNVCQYDGSSLTVFTPPDVTPGPVTPPDNSTPALPLIVSFIDVNQGDSTLIQYNGKCMLIDGGNIKLDAAPMIEAYLNSQNVKEINVLVASHPDADHIEALDSIMNDYKVDQVYDDGMTTTSDSDRNYVTAISTHNIPDNTPAPGSYIDFDPAIKIEVLSPPVGDPYEGTNDNSIVLKLTYSNVSFLFMGDAGKPVEQNITALYNVDADILKVGHHGSSSASGINFLTQVTPAVSVIEVGANNPYKHPAPVTLIDLAAVNSKVYRTDLNGTIVVTTDGMNYNVSMQKGGDIIVYNTVTPTLPPMPTDTPVPTMPSPSPGLPGLTVVLVMGAVAYAAIRKME